MIDATRQRLLEAGLNEGMATFTLHAILLVLMLGLALLADYITRRWLLHWIRKLVKRLRKYQGRVISVVGAPIVGDDVKIDKVHICPL